MKQTLLYSIKVLIIIVSSFAIYLLTEFYGSLMEYQSDFIIKVNVISMMLIAICKYLIILINSKRHLKLNIETYSQVSTEDNILKRIARKRQINFFSVPAFIIGLSNLALYFLFINLIHNHWIIISSAFMLVPIGGYFESKKELKNIYLNKVVSYSIKNSILEYKIDGNTNSYDLKSLRFIKKINNTILLIDAKSQRNLIINLR